MAKDQTPIFSTRDAEAELREAIDRFVIGLAEQIDLLQDAECAGKLEQLASLSTVLGENAASLGFGSLAELSRMVCDACAEDRPELARKALEEATEIARRIRLGHRGAL
jgi:hypothetical protein